MGCPHTHFTKGKRVRIGLKAGGTVVAKFVERKSTHVVCADAKGNEFKVYTAAIASMSHLQRKSPSPAS